LKETRPLWPPQRGVGLQEPNLGKTNPRVTLFICLRFVFPPSLADSFIFLTLTRLVVVFIFVNFSFALFTPPPSRRLSVPLNERHDTGARSSGARYGVGREAEAGGWWAVGGGGLPVIGVRRLRVGVATAVARRAREAASHLQDTVS
jgi:hypothetical protein